MWYSTGILNGAHTPPWGTLAHLKAAIDWKHFFFHTPPSKVHGVTYIFLIQPVFHIVFMAVAWVQIPTWPWKLTGIEELVKPPLKYLTYLENPLRVTIRQFQPDST